MPRRKSSSRHSTAEKREKLAYLKRFTSREQRDDLKRHGYTVNTTGVYLDQPRDKERKRIPGAKLEIQKGGIVKWSVGQRRDFIVGFTPKEKKEFAKNPEAFTAFKLQELIASHPQTFKKIRKPPNVRLQWGAYQAQKDFAPNYFAKIYPNFDKTRANKRTREARDRLVGLHVVIHIPKKRKRTKRK